MLIGDTLPNRPQMLKTQLPYILVVVLCIIRTCYCAFEFELLNPDEPFSERMYTTDDGDLYIIVYNEHDGSPIGVEPYFPASMKDPDIGCQQLYAHGLPPIPEFARYGPQNAKADRVIHTLPNDEWMGVFFRSRGIQGREGLRFGCEVLFRQLDGTWPYHQNTVRWFMSCDPARDRFRVYHHGEYPFSRGSCWPIDPEAEERRRVEQEERERKRKAGEPDEDENQGWKDRKFKMKASQGWVQGQLMRWTPYSSFHSMGDAYPAAAQRVSCKDVEL